MRTQYEYEQDARLVETRMRMYGGPMTLTQVTRALAGRVSERTLSRGREVLHRMQEAGKVRAVPGKLGNNTYALAR